MLGGIWYHLQNFKKGKNSLRMPVTSLKVTLLHEQTLQFLQFKKREKHPRRSDTFSKVAGY